MESFKVKAFMDSLKEEEGYAIIQEIIDIVANTQDRVYDDDTFTFNVSVSRIKKLKNPNNKFRGVQVIVKDDGESQR